MTSRILTCRELDHALLGFRDALREQKFDYVLGIARGGLTPSTKVSHLLGIPHITAAVDRVSGSVSCAPAPRKGARVLIVDTMARTGATLEVVKRRFPNSKTLVVFSSTDTIHHSDFILLITDDWIEADWEGEWLRKSLGEEAQLNAEVGFDLDGVITPDVFPPKFLWGWHFVWKLVRSRQPLVFSPPPDAVIVTGRPEIDAEYTRRWLKRHGVHNHIEFNHGTPTLENAVRTKVGAIRSKGIKVFYESDPVQVREIQDKVEGCRVVLWEGKL